MKLKLKGKRFYGSFGESAKLESISRMTNLVLSPNNALCTVHDVWCYWLCINNDVLKSISHVEACPVMVCVCYSPQPESGPTEEPVRSKTEAGRSRDTATSATSAFLRPQIVDNYK